MTIGMFILILVICILIYNIIYNVRKYGWDTFWKYPFEHGFLLGLASMSLVLLTIGAIIFIIIGIITYWDTPMF